MQNMQNMWTNCNMQNMHSPLISESLMDGVSVDRARARYCALPDGIPGLLRLRGTDTCRFSEARTRRARWWQLGCHDAMLAYHRAEPQARASEVSSWTRSILFSTPALAYISARLCFSSPGPYTPFPPAQPARPSQTSLACSLIPRSPCSLIPQSFPYIPKRHKMFVKLIRDRSAGNYSTGSRIAGWKPKTDHC